MATDERLCQQLAAGHHAALESLYQRHKDRVFRLLLRLVGESDASDLLQDVFVRVFRSAHTFRGDAQFTTWLYRLSVNTARSFLAQQRRKHPATENLDDMSVPGSSSHRTDPMMQRHLLRALEQLPQKYREVIVLHDIHELTHKEIAAILGVRVGTSKSQLHKARKRMRVLLQSFDTSTARSSGGRAS